MVIKFKAFPRGSLIGNGAYRFRHYGEEIQIPLCFTAQESNSTISMVVNGRLSKGQAFETSVNGTTWEEFIPGTTIITLTNVGDKVYFRGDNITVSESVSNYCQYAMTGKIAASGNIMSLLDKTCSAKNVPTYCYYKMFNNCASLTTAPNLPATKLALNCYTNMFYYCTSLYVSDTYSSSSIRVWKIPTTGITSGRPITMSNMFAGCLGTRSTDSPSFNSAQKTYYTQNVPV